MPLLEHGNNRDNYRGDITHGKPVDKQISIGLIKELQVLMVISINKIFLIGYLI